MAAKVALIVFGLFIGVILGITGMSLIVVSPFFTEAKALSDISNLVVAIGAVFTLGFTLWQHQQQLDRDRKQALPRVRLMGAPIHKTHAPDPSMASVEIEFQFLNENKNPAADLRFRIFSCPIDHPELMVVCKDDTMANSLFGGQGFHWVLKASFAKSIDARGNEAFVYLRLDYRDSDADGELLLSEYFLKVNHAEAAVANASKVEVEPFKGKILLLA